MAKYEIYFPKDERFEFRDMGEYEKEGVPVNKESFSLVYTGEYEDCGNPLEDADEIYLNLNSHDGARPRDYKERSLSVGDIVVLDAESDSLALYCGRYGWSLIRDF